MFDTSELHVDFLQPICSYCFQERVECVVSELIVGGWYCSLDVPYESPVRSRGVTIELLVEWCPATLKSLPHDVAAYPRVSEDVPQTAYLNSGNSRREGGAVLTLDLFAGHAARLDSLIQTLN